MKLNIKLDNIDEELMFKRITFKVGDKKVVTPIKVSHKQNPISHINEIYKKFDIDKLNKCSTDESFERKTNSELRNLMTQGINICMVDFSDLKIPNKTQLETLSDLQYEHSDIVTTPIMSKITRELVDNKLLDTFTDITNRYIEIVETLNHKSIMGVIPSKMPRQFLEPIIKNYHNKDINSFILDFDGRSIETNPSWVRKLMRLLKEYDLIEESVLYSVNSNEGKFMKNASEILAKDFVSTGFGIDLLGLNHIPPRMSSEAWAKIKAQRRKNTFRLFNRNSYGYLKKTEAELKALNIKDRTSLKNFNISEQFKETQILQQKLKEENSIEPYIRSKSQVNDDFIKKIKKLRANTFKR